MWSDHFITPDSFYHALPLQESDQQPKWRIAVISGLELLIVWSNHSIAADSYFQALLLQERDYNLQYSIFALCRLKMLSPYLDLTEFKFVYEVLWRKTYSIICSFFITDATLRQFKLLQLKTSKLSGSRAFH